MIGRIRALVRGALSLSRENPTKNADCSEFEVDNWAISAFVLRKLVPVVGAYPFPLHELMIEEVLGRATDRYRKLHSGLGLPGMTLLYPAAVHGSGSRASI